MSSRGEAAPLGGSLNFGNPFDGPSGGLGAAAGLVAEARALDFVSTQHSHRSRQTTARSSSFEPTPIGAPGQPPLLPLLPLTSSVPPLHASTVPPAGLSSLQGTSAQQLLPNLQGLSGLRGLAGFEAPERPHAFPANLQAEAAEGSAVIASEPVAEKREDIAAPGPLPSSSAKPQRRGAGDRVGLSPGASHRSVSPKLSESKRLPVSPTVRYRDVTPERLLQAAVPFEDHIRTAGAFGSFCSSLRTPATPMSGSRRRSMSQDSRASVASHSPGPSEFGSVEKPSKTVLQASARLASTSTASLRQKRTERSSTHESMRSARSRVSVGSRTSRDTRATSVSPSRSVPQLNWFPLFEPRLHGHVSRRDIHASFEKGLRGGHQSGAPQPLPVQTKAMRSAMMQRTRSQSPSGNSSQVTLQRGF
eukprot:TRINITY_DN28761_c0_g1_i1.p1 TRINITY_DN28761_c0_g1~~TRINITY_DN28761_c0_g1_i1.p1  ORF type:complete len:419 (-),score=46.15 TRINITY_DN28761_c0_g1_i1:219-1475(-)